MKLLSIALVVAGLFASASSFAQCNPSGSEMESYSASPSEVQPVAYYNGTSYKIAANSDTDGVKKLLGLESSESGSNYSYSYALSRATQAAEVLAVTIDKNGKVSEPKKEKEIISNISLITTRKSSN